MSRAASYSSVSGQPKTFAIAGSLLLVSVSYVLLLSAPVITRHLRSVVSNVGGVKSFEWLPLACGAGLVLGGASALVFVLTQIAREAERRPYVCLAPVLAAFSGCVLIGLRAELPLKGVASEHIAVFALAVSVVGGSLVQTSRVAAQMLGLAFTFLPPLSLFVMMWTLSGKLDPAQAVWSLSSPARGFLGMLTLSSFAIAGVATIARHGEPRLHTRLPRGGDNNNYVVYDLEDDLLADEARMRQRGLPGWAIVLAAATAVALGFMALKVFLERRPALNFLAPTAPSAAPVEEAASAPALRTGSEESAPAVQPASPEVEPSAPSPNEPAPSEGAAPAAPVPLSQGEKNEAEAPKAAPEQPLRAQMPVQPAAPEQARKAALSATSRASRVAHKAAVRAERRAVHAAPAPVEKPAPVAREEKPALRAEKVEKSAPPAPAKVEAKPAPVEAKKPQKPQNIADLAVQAAALATPRGQGKSAAKPASDDGLEELMDNSLKPDKSGKKQKANDDPIYGL